MTATDITIYRDGSHCHLWVLFRAMGRWEADAWGRLRKAAMELYADRGYDQTTVAEIAQRAGLTERTFFRHFADKREVLFSGSENLQEAIVGAVESAPASATAIEAVAAGIETAGDYINDRDYSRQRQAIIAANPTLQERELIKMAALAGAIAGALRKRGVAEPAASLTAEAGTAVFRVAFGRWLQESKKDLRAFIRESMEELRGAVAR
jgi:AcrR family transcriptional regulator